MKSPRQHFQHRFFPDKPDGDKRGGKNKNAMRKIIKHMDIRRQSVPDGRFKNGKINFAQTELNQ